MPIRVLVANIPSEVLGSLRRAMEKTALESASGGGFGKQHPDFSLCHKWELSELGCLTCVYSIPH